jgi:hypothetical protein
VSSFGRQLAVAVAALMAVAAAAFAFTTGGEGGRRSDGPLDPGNPHGWSVTEPAGDTFTDGMELLRLHGDRDAVIEDVRLVGDEGLELVGAKLASPERGIGWIQYRPAFPPANDPDLGDVLVDAVGATITPLVEDQGGWELLLGIQATGEGYLVRTGVEVDYRVGKNEYTVLLPAHLAVCTSPRLERKGACPLPLSE